MSFRLNSLVPAMTCAAVLSACGAGGAGDGSAAFLNSTFLDAPTAGLCYSASPSNKTGTTASDGTYEYRPGDQVTFWIDGGGSGCANTTANSPTSVRLGSVVPTATRTFVLAFQEGPQIADTLTALNVGSASAMNVGGLKLNATDVGNLNNYVSNSGVLPPTANGSIDTFFSGVQANTILASNSNTPAFVTSVINQSTGPSVLGSTVASNLYSTAAGLGVQSVGFSQGGTALSFNIAYAQYTLPLSSSPTAIYTGTLTEFFYLDSGGNVARFINPGPATITTVNLSQVYGTGTYTPAGNVFIKPWNGTELSNGYTYTEPGTYSVNYSDYGHGVWSGSFTNIYTSGPDTGRTYLTGTCAGSSTSLTPLTLSMLAGHQITFEGSCPANSSLPMVYTFSSDGKTMTSSCGTLPLTWSTTAIPGILEATDTSGFITYVGLVGPSVVSGSYFAIIQENPGSLGTSGNGGPNQWSLSTRFSAINN